MIYNKNSFVELIVFFILIFIIEACNSNNIANKDELIIKNDKEINYSPKYPEAGRKIQITYPLYVGGSNQKKLSDHYIRIQIFNNRSSYFLSKKMTLDIDSSFYQVDFIIPKKTLFIILEITKYNEYQKKNFIGIPIFKNNIPVEGSLPLLLQFSKSYKQAKFIFDIDKKYYPENLSRISIFWKLLVNHNLIQKDIVKSKLDSLIYHFVNKNKDNDLIENKIIAYSVFSQLSAVLGESKKTLVFLDSCFFLIKKNPSKYYHFGINNRSYIFYKFVNHKGSMPVNRNNNLTLRIVKRLVDIFSLSNNLQSFNSFCMYSDSLFVTNNISYFGKYINYNINKIKNLKYPDDMYKLSEETDLFYNAIKVLLYLKKFKQATELLESSKTFLSLPDFYDNIALRTIYSSPISPIYASVKMQLSEAFLALKDTNKAINLLKETIFNIPENNYTKGAKSLSAILLTTIFIKKQNIDSAKKYLIIANQLESPFVPNKLNDFIKLCRRKKMSQKYINEFKSLINNSYYKKKKIIPEIIIKTNKEIVNTKKLLDTVLSIFFYNNECPICNISSVAFQKIVNKIKVIPHKEIYISNSANQKKLFEAYGNDILIANNLALMKTNFPKIKFPYILIIRNGYLLYESESFPKTRNDFLNLISMTKH